MKLLLLRVVLTFLTSSSLCAQTSKPLTANTFFKKGVELHHKNDLKNAILYYSEALERDKTHSEAMYNRAMAYFTQQKYAKCIVDLTEFLKIHPNDADALERCGNAALLLKNYEDAIFYYTKVIATTPSARLLTNRGIAALERGNIDLATKDFKAALKNEENYTEAMIGLGNVYFASNEYDKAYTQYNNALKKGSTDKRLIFNMAITNSKKKAYTAAITQFTQILSTQESAETFAQRAYCYYKIGKSNKALEDATKANQMDIRNAFAYNILALLHLQEGDADLAELTYSEGLTWEPNQAELLAGRGYARYKLKFYKSALADLNTSISASPSLGAAYYTRASVKVMLGDKKEACKDYKKALSIGYEAFTNDNSTNFCEETKN
jgi:tetratricopeptide (TPR) repeat protein